MIRGTRLLVFVVAASLFVGCTGESDEPREAETTTEAAVTRDDESPEPIPTHTPAPTPTPTKEPEPPYPYKGFPNVVDKQEVPSNMRWTINTPQVVAVAPGVWTEKIPGIRPLQSAQDGAYIGYCAAVKEAVKKLNNSNGNTCW